MVESDLDRRLRLIEYGISEVRVQVLDQLVELKELRDELRRANEEHEQSRKDFYERGLCGRANPVSVSSD